MKVDMSAEAVTARLKLASQLQRLCLALGKAKPVADEDRRAQFGDEHRNNEPEKVHNSHQDNH